MRFVTESQDFSDALAAVSSALKALDWKGTCLVTAGKKHVTIEASAGGGYFKRTLTGAKVEQPGEVTISTEQVPAFPAAQTTFDCSDSKKIKFTSGRLHGFFLALTDADAVERIDKEIKPGMVVSAPMLHQMIRTILFEPSTPDIPMSLRLLTRKKTRTVRAVVFDAYRAAVFEQQFDDEKKVKKAKHEQADDRHGKSKKNKKEDPADSAAAADNFHVTVLDDIDYSFPKDLVDAIYGLFEGDVQIGTSSKLAYFADERTVLYHPYSSTDEANDVDKFLGSLREQKPLLEATLDPAAAQLVITPACAIISRKDGMLTLTPEVGKKTLGVRVASDYAGTKTSVDLMKLKLRKAVPFSVAYGYLMEFLSQVSWYVTPDEDGKSAGVQLRVWPKCLTLSVPQAIYVMPLTQVKKS
jgi:hypothetical protein